MTEKVETPTAPPVEHLTAALTRLADARYHRALARAEVARRMQAWQDENQEALLAVDALTVEESSAEQVARELVLAHFKASPDKNRKPVAGAEVKMKKTANYNAIKALQFAKEKGLFLVPESLDVAAFEKSAPHMDLDWFTIEEVPAVTIARDLDTALGLNDRATEPAPATVTE